MTAKVVGFAGSTNPDGTYSLIVKDGDKPTFELVIDPTHMQQIVATYQKAAVLDADQQTKNMRFPIFELDGVNLAHAGRDTQLLASTLQIGQVVLRAENKVLEEMKRKIDAVLTYRSTSSASH